MTKHPKRPRDPAQLAKFVVDLATGHATEIAHPEPRNTVAAELGRKGGVARAKKLSKKQRSEIAKKAARQRWKENA